MLVLNHLLPCYHLEIDGGDNADQPSREVLAQHGTTSRTSTTSRLSKAHGCLPPDIDLAFAFGTLKHGGLDPVPGAVRPAIDPVVRLRHQVFAAFNECLVHYLSSGIGPRIDSAAAAASETQATLSSSDADGCELCAVVSRLALHSSACEQHYLVCSDLCLLLYNLIAYHLGVCYCRRSLCDAVLCDELRTVLLQGQPIEQQHHGLDRAWYRLRSRLADALQPRQRTATSTAELLQLARRMAGLQLNGGAGGGRDASALGRTAAATAADGAVAAKDIAASCGFGLPGASSFRLGQGSGTGSSTMPIASAAGDPATAGRRGGDGGSDDCRASASSCCCSSVDCPDWNLPSSSNLLADLKLVIGIGSIPTGDELEERLANVVSEFGLPATDGRAVALPAAAALAADDSVLLPRLSLLCPSAADGVEELASAGPQVPPGGEAALLDAAVQLPAPAALNPGLRLVIGRGRVAYGEPRHLLELVQYWKSLQERLNDRLSSDDDVADSCDADFWEGIILTGKDSQLKVQDGNYQKRVHWTKQTFLGRGVSGQVHLAIDNATEFSFVIKKVGLLGFTHEELCVWAELEHPGIVQLYGALRNGQKLYYLCEFYAGGTLSALVQRSRALDQWKALLYMDQILNALAYLHKKRIIHEDLKADNIFLKLESHVLGIGDFGLSCKLRPGQNSVVAGKQPLGGQTQWSPEKARSDGHGFAADIWAAMCTMVHMLSGHHPWEQRFKGCHMLHYVIALNSPPKDDIPHGLLDEVLELVLSGWAMDPHQRPTANELLHHRCFDHLQNGFPGDPKYASHFAHLQFVLGDVSDSHAGDSIEELDEDGENYIAEIVEKVRRESTGHESGAGGSSSAATAARAAVSGSMLWTEHDILRSDAICAGESSSGSSGSPNFDWSSAAAPPPPASKERLEQAVALLPARLHCEAIEEEPPGSFPSGGTHAEPLPPLPNADTESPSPSAAASSSATTMLPPPGGAGSSGKHKRRFKPGLHVNVRVTSPTAAPVSPSSRSLRHSRSLDDGQSAATSPGSSGSVGSSCSGGEGKGRTLRHTLTSPSILTTASQGVLGCVGGERPPQYSTPLSAGSSSMALRSSDLNTAVPPALALPTAQTLVDAVTPKRWSTPLSSAYGSGTPGLLSEPPSGGSAFVPHARSSSTPGSHHHHFAPHARSSSTPGSHHHDGAGSSSSSSSSARGRTVRDSSQGYMTGCSTAASESAFSPFDGSCSATPLDDRGGACLPCPLPLAHAGPASSAYPAHCGDDGFRPQLCDAEPPSCNLHALSAVASEVDGLRANGDLASPCLSSSPTCSGGDSPSPLPKGNSGMPPKEPPATAGPMSLANPDTSFVITSSDYEMEMTETTDGLIRPGAMPPVLVAGSFDLRLPDEQEPSPEQEKEEVESDNEEFLSRLQLSFKKSGSLNNPHAIFMVGDMCSAQLKDQEIGKLKLSHDMTWQEAVKLMSSKVHKSGFESFTVLHQDGKELLLHEKIPFQSVTLIVKAATEDGSWQWWITNGVIKDNDKDGHHGLFLDSRP